MKPGNQETRKLRTRETKKPRNQETRIARQKNKSENISC
jgi:hypothetical protein